jgi:hypothetical protein
VLLHLGRDLRRRRGDHRLSGVEVLDAGSDGDVVAPVLRNVVGHVRADGSAVRFALQPALNVDDGMRMTIRGTWSPYGQDCRLTGIYSGVTTLSELPFTPVLRHRQETPQHQGRPSRGESTREGCPRPRGAEPPTAHTASGQSL